MNKSLLRFWIKSGISTEIRAKKEKWNGKLKIASNAKIGKIPFLIDIKVVI